MPTDIMPAETDIVTASPARIYDCYLNGTSHYPVDSEVASKVLAAVPDARELAKASRAFTVRVTRLMARRGIRQFLDIGCGLATQPSIHQAAHAIQPGARVLYTDKDPSVARNHPALGAGAGVAFMLADLRRAHGLLARAEEYNIDFGQPLGLLLTGVLPYLTWPEAPHLNVGELTRRLAPGSYVALSHPTCVGTSPEAQARNRDGVRGRQCPGLLLQTTRHRALPRRLAPDQSRLDRYHPMAGQRPEGTHPARHRQSLGRRRAQTPPTRPVTAHRTGRPRRARPRVPSPEGGGRRGPDRAPCRHASRH